MTYRIESLTEFVLVGSYRLNVGCAPTLLQTAAQCNQVMSGSTAGGSSSAGSAAPDVWWPFTAPNTGLYTFNSCGSSYDTWIHIYSRIGTTGIGNQVATCDDCGPCGLQTVLSVSLTSGLYWYCSSQSIDIFLRLLCSHKNTSSPANLYSFCVIVQLTFHVVSGYKPDWRGVALLCRVSY